jgi:hypothetical protein
MKAISVAVLALAACSCAQVQAPSGGPEDTQPPHVTLAYPESAAVHVPLGDSLALRFSEPVDRRSVEDAFVFSPPVDYRERSWQRDTWILRLREPIRPGLTYAGLLGTAAKDRHGIALKKAWSWAFSTGDSLDDGAIAGNVIGQRFPGKGAAVYAWSWDSVVPDTTQAGVPPDPLRVGQADPQGSYELAYLPRGRPLRIGALYDRDADRSFDPGDDRWAFLDTSLTVPDTGRVVTGVDLYLAASDEPGTVAGTLADSSCLRSTAAKVLQGARARRDSLRGWLDGRVGVPPDLPGRAGVGSARASGEAGIDSTGEAAPVLTAEDSLLVGRAYLRLDSLETAARAESVFCSRRLVVRLLEGDTTLVRESQEPRFSWTDVPPGIYRLSGFRDLDGNGRPGPDEPAVSWPHPLELLPLRKLDNLLLQLSPRGAPPDTTGGIEGGSSPGEPADTTGATGGGPPSGVPSDTLRSAGDKPGRGKGRQK